MQRMTRKDSKDVAALAHGTCDLRQENALKNWQRRSMQWQQMEERMAKKLNKDPSQLVMSRIDEYRMLVEERQVIEEARMLSEGKYSFPQCGLKIGNDLVGLSMITQKTAPREIERIATARGENTLRSESRKGESYMITRRQQLQEAISTLDPMYLVDSVSKLEVEGRGITAKDTQSHENNFIRVKSTVEGEQVLSRKTPSQHSRISTDVKQIEPFEDNLNPNLHSNTETTRRSEASGTAHQNELVRYIGPYLQQSTDICFFNNKTNDMSMANFRIHNRGSTAVHFEWRKKIMANPLNVKTSRNSIQRFYFYNKKGLVLPGETIDFQIIYKSSKPGMFSEIWELDTAPKMPPGCKGIQVKFEGITLETDEVEAARKRIRDALLRREATNVATEIIDNLFKCVWHKVEFNANNRHVNNDEAEMFKMMNQKLHLRYSRNTLSAFEQLAGDVFRTLHIPPELSIWDKSVMSLNQLILSIPDSSVRSECLKRLNMGIKSSFLPPVQTVTSLLYITGYDVLTDLADKVADASERIRTDLNLPLLRGCTQKFTDLEKEWKEDSGITGEAASKSVDSKKLPTSSIPHPTSVESKQKSQASLLPVIPKDATKSKTAVSSRQSSLKAVVKEEDISSLPSREPPTKILTDLPGTWSEDRKAMESLYLRHFQDMVYKWTDKAVDRMQNLFGEIRQEI